MSNQQDAANAILAAIEKAAPEADVAGVGVLATAYQQVVHGPQGGAMRTNGETDYRYSATTDNTHQNHNHNHLAGRANGVGFEAS